MVQGRQRVVSYKVHNAIKVPEEEWFVVHNTHEPTFTQEEYDILARLLQRDTRTANGERTVHLFSGFLRCYDCQKALQRKAAKSHVYYACRTYTEKSKDKCTKHSIRVDILEDAVLTAIQGQIALVDSLMEAVGKINQAPAIDAQSRRIDKMLREKQREAERAKAFSDGLYMDWKSGDITHEDYRRMKAKFEEQIAQLGAVIENLEDEQQRMGQGLTSENPLFTAFCKHRKIQHLDRIVLVELVDTIYVHEDKEISIAFRFADEMERIIEFVEVNGGIEVAAA